MQVALIGNVFDAYILSCMMVISLGDCLSASEVHKFHPIRELVVDTSIAVAPLELQHRGGVGMVWWAS